MISIGDELDGKYIVVRKLGSGGFGEVFLAHDEVACRHVAIKVLRRDDRDQGLIWEMQALAALDLQGVVAFYHHFTEGNRLFLVMEHCAGGSLQERLRGAARFPEMQVMEWAVALCETLGAVHDRGIVHHDIKPANILFHADKRIKVGDFGVANRNTGTCLYLPPEVLLREASSRTDPRVDIYCLGLTLIETLTGVHPFSFMSAKEAMEARIRHDFVPDTLSRWVQEVLLKATHPTPELRFQTMRDFTEAIATHRVPYVFDSNRMKAHMLAESAQVLIERKKWESAQKLVDHALQLDPDCVAALITAGRCHLMVRRIDRAEDHFSKAISINPRTPVQKELGLLHLEAGRIPIAISLLTDHLQRNGADFEAYNLLIKCYFLSDRYEAGEDLADAVLVAMQGVRNTNDCFETNRFLCRLLSRGERDAWFFAEALRESGVRCPFLGYNMELINEWPKAWGGGRATLKSKLLFEEYRFGSSHRMGDRNTVTVHPLGGQRQEMSQHVISIGSLAANDIVIEDRSVSRRHALLVNFRDEVWLYDLESYSGTSVDSRKVFGRAFLDGVHEVGIGRARIRIASKSGLLV